MTDIAQIGISIDTKDVKVAQGELGKLANAADNAGEEIEQLGNEAQTAGKKVNTGLAKPAKSAGDALGGYERNAGKAGKSTGRFGQLAGQAGFQVNDFVVQVQGGQSALLAFSQQGSQLLGAFGSIGAVAGAVLALGAAVGGVLFNQLNKGDEAVKQFKTGVDDLRESLEELNKAQILGGLVELRKETKKLSKQEKALVKDIEELKEKQKEVNEVTTTNVRVKARQEASLKAQKKLLDEIQEKEDALYTIQQQILDNNILTGDANEKIANQSGKVLDIEKKKNEMHFQNLQMQRLQSQQLDEFLQENERLFALDEKANAKKLLDLQKIIEKNQELNDLLDLRFEREFEQDKGKNDAFLQSMVNKNKTELETLTEHLQTIKDLEFSFARDGELRKQAQAAVEAQIEEGITKKAEEEALKRRQLTAGYFQDASDIMSTFNDFMSLSSIGRKQTLEDELRNNKSLSAEQVKNKEAELRGIFNQEKERTKRTALLMSTAAGVMTQLATGNLLGAIKVGAAGAVNYAKASATSFKSPAPAPSSPVSSSPQQTTSNVTFDFSNIPSNAMITADGLVDMMKQSLRDAKLNGEVI